MKNIFLEDDTPDGNSFASLLIVIFVAVMIGLTGASETQINDLDAGSMIVSDQKDRCSDVVRSNDSTIQKIK